MPKTKILLFYDGFEMKAREHPGARLFHKARCALRAIVRRLRGKQVNTGFFEAFLAIKKGLEKLGYEVRVNDFADARRAPEYPIGIAGYPDVFDHVTLTNPMIFGPGDPGYPDEASKIAARPSTRFIIQPSDWFVDYYRPYCGDKMMRCPVGIDVDGLPDCAEMPKTCDVLIYDKIRWHREEVEPQVLHPLIDVLKQRKLSYEIVRYGEHTQGEYFDKLKRSRAMVFICEHETQGLACEEALAMNIPVFAWDEGLLVDPRQRVFASDDLVVSSVPYFDERCGEVFKIAQIEAKFDTFWSRLPRYSPRDYVSENLRPETTARVFAEAYLSMRAASDT